jgi:hypothetical protein
MKQVTYYRHKDGLFPPFRDHIDYVPVPYFFAIDQFNVVTRVGTDGVRYISQGWTLSDLATINAYIDTGVWVEFDPLSVGDWKKVLTGELGHPSVFTPEGVVELPGNYPVAWRAAGRAREEMTMPAPAPEPDKVPAFFITNEGLFADGPNGPYYASLDGDEFVCHTLDGKTHRMEALQYDTWRDWVETQIAFGYIVAFDPKSIDDWNKVVLPNFHVKTKQGIEKMPDPKLSHDTFVLLPYMVAVTRVRLSNEAMQALGEVQRTVQRQLDLLRKATSNGAVLTVA